tara:strand:- start:805 stop:1905 length:1101 start_codon:yes stop_codon:yes gene_type:complete
MNAPQPNSGIMEIAPYVGGDAKAEGIAKAIKLSSNESATGASPKAIAAYKALADELHRYPDGGSNELRDTLAEWHGLEAQRIVCGNGSDEILSLLVHAYAGPGDEVLYSEYGFLMYPLNALASGARPVKAPEVNYTASVDNILSAVTERTRMVMLANPNNPTGTYLAADELRRLRAGLDDSVLLVLDSAYAEFVQRNDYSAGIEFVRDSDNVVMTRTFSKIYGLAALRVGWAYCPEAIAGVLHRVRGPFNVNAAAQRAAVAALQDSDHTEMARRHNDTWLPWLQGELEGLGLQVIPSVGNFLTVHFPPGGPRSTDKALAFLKARGILPRGIAAYGMADHLRFTIGLEDENKAVVAALSEFLNATDG